MTQNYRSLPNPDVHSADGLPAEADAQAGISKASRGDGLYANRRPFRPEDAEFMANMSHYVRTPLTSLLGFASVLAHELTGEQKRHAGIIEQSGRKIAGAMNAMLLYSDLNARIDRMRVRTVDLASVARDVVDSLAARANAKGLIIESSALEGSHWVRGDEDALETALGSLVDNAIRYTDAGSVSFEIARSNGSVTLRIRDTGPGISEDLRPVVFEPFRQEKDAVDRDGRGAGMGLMVASRLFSAMGGSVRLERSSSEGSVFAVHLSAADEGQSGDGTSDDTPG